MHWPERHFGLKTVIVVGGIEVFFMFSFLFIVFGPVSLRRTAFSNVHSTNSHGLKYAYNHEHTNLFLYHLVDFYILSI